VYCIHLTYKLLRIFKYEAKISLSLLIIESCINILGVVIINMYQKLQVEGTGFELPPSCV